MYHWQHLTLYHGTDVVSAASILQNGVDLKCSRKQDLDFGPGFYMTTNRRQAESWARRISKRKKMSPGLVIFGLERQDFHDLKKMIFTLEEWDEGYWPFVRHCRTEPQTQINHRCGNDQFYDMVIGPVAETWDAYPRAKAGCDQFSVHTEKAVALLKQRFVEGVP